MTIAISNTALPLIIRLPQALRETKTNPVLSGLSPLKPQANPLQLLLDMSLIRRLDWQDAAVLMEAMVAIQKLGGRLALMQAQPEVMAFLELIQINRMLPVFHSEAAALSWFME